MQEAMINKLMARADALGVPLGPVAPLVARYRQLQDQITASRAAGDSAFAAAVNELASTGKISDSVTTKLALYDQVVFRGREPSIERAVDHARTVVMRDAYEAGVKAGPDVFAALQKVAGGAVERVAAVKIPRSVMTERDAFSARVAREDWDELHAAWAVWNDAHEAYGLLRQLGWLPLAAPVPAVRGGVVIQGEPGERWRRYGNPMRCPATVSDMDLRNIRWVPALFLAHSLRDNARPGMYSPEEALAACTRHAQAAHDAEGGISAAVQAARKQQIAEVLDLPKSGRFRRASA